jgi:serine/threonine protein kinase
MKKKLKTFFALELAQGEDLFDYVQNTGAFEDELCRYYFKQMLEALEYCHKKGYCHRDLKLANILLDENYQIKLADFGFASLLEGYRGKDKLDTIAGTRSFMAPELIEEKFYNGETVDLFSAAVILFLMRS